MSEIETYLATLPESRRERMQQYMAAIEGALPGVEPRFWDSGSGFIGYGSYHYEYPSGHSGESMQLGLANRAKYIAIYACGADSEHSIATDFKDQLPGCKIGKACIEAPDRASIDDTTLAELAQTVFASFEEAKRRPKEAGETYIWE